MSPRLAPVPALGCDRGPGPQGRLIHGDNLAVLRLLEPELAGRVQLAYLDPPYNTGNRFEHYADRRASAAWADMMRPRLAAVHALLAPTGFLVVQIDDKEQARLQLLLDELFGAEHRRNTVVVKMSELSGVKMGHVGHRLPKLKEYLLVYARSAEARLHPVTRPKTGPAFARYLDYYTWLIDNPADPPERWTLRRVRAAMEEAGLDPQSRAARHAFLLEHRDRAVYRTNNRFLAGLQFDVPIRRVSSPTGIAYIWWEGRQMLFLKDHCDEVLGDLWTDISTINLNKEGGVRFRNGKKPEALLARILDLTTAPGDLVLDPFLGSGSTAAVAHKLGRHWVGIEAGPHCRTHARERLRRVVEGEDQGGISRDQPWAGGGRFTTEELTGTSSG